MVFYAENNDIEKDEGLNVVENMKCRFAKACMRIGEVATYDNFSFIMYK